MHDEVHAVITWVDGDGLPELAQWRERMADQLPPRDLAPYRWRDNGELRYALRALEAHAPWIETVHLVTAGQTPAWLDPTAPGLRVVSHHDIFPDPSVLPTFNSAAIEAAIHRIPELADHYLYFNDDVILMRPTERSDFLTEDGGALVRVEGWETPTDLAAVTVTDRTLARNRQLVSPLPIPLPSHSPQIYSRVAVEALWERWRPLHARTLTHRFRHEHDALLRILYFAPLLAAGEPNRAMVSEDEECALVQVEPSLEPDERLRRLGERPRLSICVNDEVEDDTRDGWVWDRVRDFLQERFPTPSRFERVDSAGAERYWPGAAASAAASLPAQTALAPESPTL